MSALPGPLGWLETLTAHQLDTLRTAGVLIGGCLVPVFGFVLTWFARAIRRDTRHARANTEIDRWQGGEVVPVPLNVAVQEAIDSGEAARRDTAELSEWVRGTGRRRAPSGPIPRQEHP